jgi:NDP-sugar pyrophosphorylase family protein
VAVALAAGKGIRHSLRTGEIPKPIVPLAGKQIIQHIFELLAGAGLKEIHVNVHYLAYVPK